VLEDYFQDWELKMKVYKAKLDPIKMEELRKQILG
jgi:hypothetical protein